MVDPSLLDCENWAYTELPKAAQICENMSAEYERMWEPMLKLGVGRMWISLPKDSAGLLVMPEMAAPVDPRDNLPPRSFMTWYDKWHSYSARSLGAMISAIPTYLQGNVRAWAKLYNRSVRCQQQLQSGGAGSADPECWSGTEKYEFQDIDLTQGQLEVVSSPEGAMVYVDGRITGFTTPHRFDLTIGERIITLMKPGCKKKRETATVSHGTTEIITFVLDEVACPVGVGREPVGCWDGSTINTEVCVDGVWMPSDEVCPPVVPEGTKRGKITCLNGSIIHTEVLRGNRWVSSGEDCPPMTYPGQKPLVPPPVPGEITAVIEQRSILIAAPNIVYEGQAFDIVCQVFCGAAASQGEPATLRIDGAEVDTKTTSAGEVMFRWTAEGVGMRRLAVDIPVNPNCAVPGHASKMLMVSAYVEGILGQVKAERLTYEEEIETLRKRRKSKEPKVPTEGI